MLLAAHGNCWKEIFSEEADTRRYNMVVLNTDRADKRPLILWQFIQKREGINFTQKGMP